MPEPRARTPSTTGYIHQRTFFQHNRWSAHDLIGELLAQGITQVSIAKHDSDWVVSWISTTPPDVLADAAKTPLD